MIHFKKFTRVRVFNSLPPWKVIWNKKPGPLFLLSLLLGHHPLLFVIPSTCSKSLFHSWLSMTVGY